MRIKKKSKLLVTGAFTLALIAILLFVWPGFVSRESAKRENSYENVARERYVYPLTIESPNWFSYSVPEKHELLKIDEQSLKQMGDSALVEAIADYPYLGDVSLMGTMEEGLKAFANDCSAYAELITRKNYQKIFTQNAGKLIEYYAKNPRSDGQTEAVCNLLQEMINYYQNKS